MLPLRDGWDEMRFDIMSALVFDKFMRHADRRRMLLETGSRYLEETNHWNDRTWGVCNNMGKNWLGVILMRTRAFFKEPAPTKNLPVLTMIQFLERIAEKEPEPWNTMANNMLLFGINGPGMTTLTDKFPAVIING